MKKLITSALFAGALALTCSATQVTYSTSGVFGSTGTNSDTYFSYSGSGTSTVSEPFPTAANLGSFDATGAAGSVNDTFTLTVDQTDPSAGSNVLASQSFTGYVHSQSSSVLLSFEGDGPVVNWNGTNYVEFNIGYVTYGLQEYTTLSPLDTNNGLTSLNGVVIGTPEPSAWLLAGTGLIALAAGLIGRRRNAAQASA